MTSDIDLMVPIGDLDDYPMVAIITFTITCAGCFYILSTILSKPLPSE